MKAFYKENIPTKNAPTPKTQKTNNKNTNKKPQQETQDLLILRNLAGHEVHHGLAPEAVDLAKDIGLMWTEKQLGPIFCWAKGRPLPQGTQGNSRRKGPFFFLKRTQVG